LGQLEYQPWTVEQNVHVKTMVDGSPADVGLPWVAAKNAHALLTTSEIVAGLIIGQLKAAINQQKEHQRQLARPIDEIVVDGYEPPLVRFGCESCEDTWDAWVDEAGKLEDPRDALCGNEKCERQGRPAHKIEEE